MKNYIKAKRNMAIVSVVTMVLLRIIKIIVDSNELINCILDISIITSLVLVSIYALSKKTKNVSV